MIQLEGANEKKAPKLELKPLPNELKYAYLRDQQTYQVMISFLLERDKESKLLVV